MSEDHCFSTHDPGLGSETNDWGPAVWLQLRRYRSEPERSNAVRRKPVLLLHGASANHGTFTVGTPGLACCLYGHGFDPWMLDWRGSSLVVDAPANNASLRDQPHIYNFNRAAAEDLPAAIEKMRQAGVNGPVSLLGHCMGGAVAAEAIALGHLENADVDRVVLIALGLFYEAPIDSRLKSEERILERLTQAREHCVVAIDPRVVAIDPRIGDDDRSEDGWPQELKNLYDAWPGALRSHAEESNPAGALCNRLSFMYGMPYHHKNLRRGHSRPGEPRIAQSIWRHSPAYVPACRQKPAARTCDILRGRGIVLQPRGLRLRQSSRKVPQAEPSHDHHRCTEPAVAPRQRRSDV